MIEQINAKTIATMFSVTNPNEHVWAWAENKGYGSTIREQMSIYSRRTSFTELEKMRNYVREWNDKVRRSQNG